MGSPQSSCSVTSAGHFPERAGHVHYTATGALHVTCLCWARHWVKSWEYKTWHANREAGYRLFVSNHYHRHLKQSNIIMVCCLYIHVFLGIKTLYFKVFGKSGGKSGGKKGADSKTMSRSTKAGLQFPVGRIHRVLKKGNLAKRIGAGAPGTLVITSFPLICNLNASFSVPRCRPRIPRC